VILNESRGVQDAQEEFFSNNQRIISREVMMKSGYKKMSILLAVMGLLIGSAITVCADQVLRVNGSTTVQKNVMEPCKSLVTGETGVSLVVIGSGSVQGLVDLIDGKCDVAMLSDSLDDAKKAAGQLKKGIVIPPDLQAHVIAKDLLQAIVHPSNPVKKLSKEQIKGLNMGKIANWKEVGGPDSPVIVIAAPPSSGTRGVVQKLLMGGEPYAADAIVAEASKKEVESVASMAESFAVVSAGVANLPEYKGKVKLVEMDPVGRELLFVTRGAPSPSAKKVIDAIQNSGNKCIK
jgi:phosphate transport system substrate-binding protein